MSLSHFDPLANFRVFEDAFTRMLNEPQANRPWSPAVRYLRNRKRTGPQGRPAGGRIQKTSMSASKTRP